MNPDNASEIASNYEDITKLKKAMIKTVKISKAHQTLRVLDYRPRYLPAHLAGGQGSATDDFNRNPIGTGLQAGIILG